MRTVTSPKRIRRDSSSVELPSDHTEHACAACVRSCLGRLEAERSRPSNMPTPGPWDHQLRHCSRRMWCSKRAKDRACSLLLRGAGTKVKYTGPKLTLLAPTSGFELFTFLHFGRRMAVDRRAGLCRAALSPNHRHAESSSFQVHCSHRTMCKSIEKPLRCSADLLVRTRVSGPCNTEVHFNKVEEHGGSKVTWQNLPG